MLPFKIYTYNGSQEPDGQTVYILMKGNHAGKPARVPFRNSVALLCESKETAEQVFSGAAAIYHAKVFHYYLTGSVIPFLRVSDLRLVYNIYEHLFIAPPALHHRQLASYLTLADLLERQRHTVGKMITGFARKLIGYAG